MMVLETIVVCVIVGAVLITAGRSVYRLLTGRGDGCGCGGCSFSDSCGPAPGDGIEKEADDK